MYRIPLHKKLKIVSICARNGKAETEKEKAITFSIFAELWKSKGWKRKKNKLKKHKKDEKKIQPRFLKVAQFSF